MEPIAIADWYTATHVHALCFINMYVCNNYLHTQLAHIPCTLHCILYNIHSKYCMYKNKLMEQSHVRSRILPGYTYFRGGWIFSEGKMILAEQKIFVFSPVPKEPINQMKNLNILWSYVPFSFINKTIGQFSYHSSYATQALSDWKRCFNAS